MIAVVMASSSSKERVKDASHLLDYGFANCSVYEDKEVLNKKDQVAIKQGKKNTVKVVPIPIHRIVLTKDQKSDSIKKKIKWKKNLIAPIKKGTQIATVTYYENGKSIEELSVFAGETVEKWSFFDCFLKIIWQY